MGFCPITAHNFVFHPTKLLSYMGEALEIEQTNILKTHPKREEMRFKTNVHARLGKLNQCSEVTKVTMPK
jgi:hypothetical protein